MASVVSQCFLTCCSVLHRLLQEGVSPLHVAAHYGNFNIAQLLLDRGADVDKRAKVFEFV